MADDFAYPQQALREMVSELCEVEEGLSNWEVDFVDSVSEWSGDYTEKQSATIVKLYERVC